MYISIFDVSCAASFYPAGSMDNIYLQSVADSMEESGIVRYTDDSFTITYGTHAVKLLLNSK